MGMEMFGGISGRGWDPESVAALEMMMMMMMMMMMEVLSVKDY